MRYEMSHTADCFLLLQWGRRTRVLEPTLGQIQTSRSCTTQVITGYGGSWSNGVVWRSMHGNVRRELWAYFLAFLSKSTKNTHGSVFYRIPETFLPLYGLLPLRWWWLRLEAGGGLGLSLTVDAVWQMPSSLDPKWLIHMQIAKGSLGTHTLFSTAWGDERQLPRSRIMRPGCRSDQLESLSIGWEISQPRHPSVRCRRASVRTIGMRRRHRPASWPPAPPSHLQVSVLPRTAV